MISYIRKLNTVDMLHGSILPSMILFNIPIVISLIFQQLYNTIDTVLVGHFLGEEALAAIGAASPFYVLLLSFSFGMGNGLSIVTARSYGSGDKDLLKRSVFMSVLIASGTSILLTLVGQIGAGIFMQATHTPTEILQDTQDYILTISRFMIVMVAYNLCSALLKAIGNSFMPLVFLMISSLLNILLDILFITQLGLGVKGAAIATVIAQGFSAILCLIYILGKVPMLVPERRHLIWDKDLFWDMLSLGLSMGVMNSIVNIGTVILQSAINLMGSYIIAAHATARNVFIFTSIPITSAANSMATFTSQNFGAGQYRRIRQAMKGCILFSLMTALLVTICMIFGGRELIGWISGSSHETVLANGALYVRVMGPFYVFLGTLACCRVSLQGMGSKLLPLISSGIEMGIKIAFALILIPIFHYHAVVLCEPVAWTIMAVELVIAFYRNPYIGTGNIQ